MHYFDKIFLFTAPIKLFRKRILNSFSFVKNDTFYPSNTYNQCYLISFQLKRTVSFYYSSLNSNERFYNYQFHPFWMKVLPVVVPIFAFYEYFKRITNGDSIICDTAELRSKAEDNIEGLPVYTLADIAQHGINAERVWTTYKNGVYDITNFIKLHPGGVSHISLAAGSSIDPFWEVYTQHKSLQIYEILEEMRIGNFDKSSILKKREDDFDSNNIYINEPNRSSALKIVSEKPFNAETPLEILADNYITPNNFFFIRNHLPVPKMDEKEYKIELHSINLDKPIIIKFDDIKKKFKKYEITATLQCAGNRRNDFNKYKPVKGLRWNIGAIGNAKWGGISLKEFLEYFDFTFEKMQKLNIKHIIFEGCDTDIEKKPYGASIPMSYVFSNEENVLLAYEMNNEVLPEDHGYPLRALVAGVVGARSVKWLSKIILSEKESDSFWQKNDYKSFSPNIDWTTVDWKKAPSIQEYPVQSGICYPHENAYIDEEIDEIVVKGYAWSGGGRAIIRIEVSIDDGKSWYIAKPLNNDENTFEEVEDWSEQRVDKAWSWVIWSVTVPVSPELRGKKIEICSRAIDASYNVQPERTEAIWNLRGCLCNSWHRVLINI